MEDMEKKDLQSQEQPGKPEENKKEANSGMVMGMCLGLAIGVAIGAATKNLVLWIPIGMCMGLSLGTVFDSQKKKKDDKKGDGDDQPQA